MQKLLVNRTRCRQYLLERAETRIPGKFTRVSEDVFRHLDTVLRTEMQKLITRHPCKGKTINTGI